MRSIGREIKCGLRPIIKRIDRRAVRLKPDAIYTCVRSHAARHLSQTLVYLFAVEVQRFSFPFFSGHAQARGYMIDCNYPFRTKQVGALDRELTYWSTAPNGDRISRLDLAVFCSHITGGENVGEKKHLLVAQPIWNLYWSNISEWHAHILRL